jgi:hypothetical protein
MIDVFAAFLSSIIGLGTTRAFDKLSRKLGKKGGPPILDSAGEAGARWKELQEWRENIDKLIRLQSHQIRQLRRQLIITRLMLDVFLVLLLALAAAWYFFAR